MRRAARVDENQQSIVKALMKVGCSVQSLAAIGAGVPDLLVGFRRSTYLLEIKDGSKSPSKRKLTEPQKRWHLGWNGRPVDVVTDVDDALRVIGL